MRITFIAIILLLVISLNEAKEKKRKFAKARKSKRTIQSKTYFGGDMLGVAPQQKGVLRAASTSNSNSKWPNGVLYFKVAKNTFNYFELEVIEKAMRNIESNTCIRFKKKTDEQDYIHLMKGDGCYSYVGRAGGSQDVSLGEGCVYVGTVVHELMHAIGFYHEHMRSDRDSYLNIHWNNIERGMKPQFEKVPARYNHLFTKFDYNSIMIYSSTAFSKNGRDTMDPKQRKHRLIEPYDKSGMSPLDIVSVDKLYECESVSKKQKRRKHKKS